MGTQTITNESTNVKEKGTNYMINTKHAQKSNIQGLSKLGEFVTAKELADVLRLTPNGVRQMWRRGVLPHPYHLGRSVRWRLADIQEALLTLKGGADHE